MKGSKEPERAATGQYLKKKQKRGVDEKGGTTALYRSKENNQ